MPKKTPPRYGLPSHFFFVICLSQIKKRKQKTSGSEKKTTTDQNKWTNKTYWTVDHIVFCAAYGHEFHIQTLVFLLLLFYLFHKPPSQFLWTKAKIPPPPGGFVHNAPELILLNSPLLFQRDRPSRKFCCLGVIFSPPSQKSGLIWTRQKKHRNMPWCEIVFYAWQVSVCKLQTHTPCRVSACVNCVGLWYNNVMFNYENKNRLKCKWDHEIHNGTSKTNNTKKTRKIEQHKQHCIPMFGRFDFTLVRGGCWT